MKTADKIKRLYSPTFLRVLSVFSIAYMLFYLWWRAANTFNPDALAFSWLLWLAEGFGVISYTLFAWMTQNVSPIHPYKPPKPGIKVDIFVPTYNESLDILEATLVGCNRIMYPHRTYLLDDGNRPAVLELAKRMGCRYIARPNHEHAKAGNINYALSQTDGEFIIILDADMVPQPNFIDRSLGYFENEKLAFIQMPQEFYNRDSIQHTRKNDDWHEQTLFFRVIQPGKNYSNSGFWCGSPSIVRRTALEDVGGVATETITEDIHTSVRLHSRGWQSLFLNEALAYGIAPQTIKSFLLQRLRWAQGTMQLYRSKDSPLWIRGLTMQQRFSYLASFLAYFEAFQKLILIMLPVFIIAFNVFPMRVNMWVLMLYWIPYFCLNILANQVGGRGHFHYFQTEKYNILKMIVFIESTITLVSRKKLTFKVTPKSLDNTVYREERNALRGYMVVFGLISGTLLYGLLHLTTWQSGITVQAETYVIVLFWAFYNAALILLSIWEVLKKMHERKQYRFPVNLEGVILDRATNLREATVRLCDLSLTGAKLSMQASIPVTHPLSLQIAIPGFKQVILPLEKIHYQHATHQGVTLGVSFAPFNGYARRTLFEYLFVTLPSLPPMQAAGKKQKRQEARRSVNRLTEGVIPSTSG